MTIGSIYCLAYGQCQALGLEMSFVSPSTCSVNTRDIFQTGREEEGDCLHSIDAPIGNATHGMSSSIVGHKVTCHNIFPAFLCEDRF